MCMCVFCECVVCACVYFVSVWCVHVCLYVCVGEEGFMCGVWVGGWVGRG